MEEVTMPNGRKAFRHNGRLVAPGAAKAVLAAEKAAAKCAARDTDHCKKCGSENLFDGCFAHTKFSEGRKFSDLLAVEKDTKGAKFRTVCTDCATFQ